MSWQCRVQMTTEPVIPIFAREVHWIVQEMKFRCKVGGEALFSNNAAVPEPTQNRNFLV